MRISHIQIENYRNLKHIDVTLSNIVALIGENNSGKSNFLHALILPLALEDGNIGKKLSWYDINKEAKEQYYDFLRKHKEEIKNGVVDFNAFCQSIPYVKICLYFQAEEKEHYDIQPILFDVDKSLGGILYHFFVAKPKDLLDHVRSIFSAKEINDTIKMSLLPMEFYNYTLTVPKKDNNISYETLSKFCAVFLPAERDNFASNVDRLGSKALSNLLQKGMMPAALAKIEGKYNEFFETIKEEGKLDTVLNWQLNSDISNAKNFFKRISILPHMPQMSSIINSIQLGYDDDSMFSQGLGYRNLILMTILLNSYLNQSRQISFRLILVEEPEAHLCNSNVLLMASLFTIFSQNNQYTQLIYSTHNVEMVNKTGLDKVIVMHRGVAYSLADELTQEEQDYLANNPNTDIFKLFYAKKVILVEGITEELLIKSYLQTRKDLNDIKVLAFHKGFTRIIDIWKKINAGSGNKLGVVRDYDNQPKAQLEHEEKENSQIIIRTTKEYTLEPEIVYEGNNFTILKKNYGERFGWTDMESPEQLEENWRDKHKTEVMLCICHDLVSGNLKDFSMPRHIQEIIDFMQGGTT